MLIHAANGSSTYGVWCGTSGPRRDDFTSAWSAVTCIACVRAAMDAGQHSNFLQRLLQDLAGVLPDLSDPDDVERWLAKP